MKSPTEENIKKKRVIKTRRRRLKFFRLLLLLLLLGAVGWVGLHVFAWGMRTYDTYYAIYQDYEARQAMKRQTMDERFDGYTNILVLGIDEGHDDAVSRREADTIFLLSLANATGEVRVLSIPPGTLANMPGRKEPDEIKRAYAYGGAPLTVQTAAGLLNVSIHQYIALDTQTLTDVIDILGGIDLYVETDMDYEDPEAGLAIHIPQGYQHLDGDAAQKYLRYRGQELGDVGRVQRQQRFIKALYERVLQLDTVTKLPQLADVFQNRMETSAEIWDSAHLAQVIKGLSAGQPKTVMLPGTPAAWDDTVWQPAPEEIQAKVKGLFPELNE